MSQSNPMHATRAIRLASALACLTLPAAAIADPVTLKSYDGTAELQGDLRAYHDGIYTLATPVGELLVSASLVACDGETCPSMRQLLNDLQFSQAIHLNLPAPSIAG